MRFKQSGITLPGFIVLLVVVGFFAFMAMKLVPPYVQYAGIVKAMNQMASEGVEGKTLDQIRRDLLYKLGFQYVDDSTLHPGDITVGQGASGNELRVNYDRTVPFMYNIDFLIHFSKVVPVQGNAVSSS